MAHFTTPEGKHYEAERATVRELLEQWHLKKAIGMTVGGEVVDCDKVFTEDTEFAPLFPDCEQGLELLRHSTAHLLAHAVLRLWPEAKFGIGPAIKDGFYYDIRFPQPISDDDLPKIEAEMRRIGGLILRLMQEGESAVPEVKDEVMELCERFPLYPGVI